MEDTSGRNFVTIMLVIAITALMLRFGLEKIIKFNIAQNESDAQSTLKLIGAAISNYAKDHLGVFPTNLSLLVKTKPQYLDKNYLLSSPLKGYEYTCPRLEETGFSCSATPQICNFSGKKIFSISPGGISWELCAKREQD